MEKLTDVNVQYTGGNIYVYSAKFNNEVWIYGALDTCQFLTYDIDPIQYEKDNNCTFDCPDNHLAIPSIPYPSFGDILDSIREAYGDNTYSIAESWMLQNHIQFSRPCIEMNDATLESVFTGKSGSHITVWRFGWNDYGAAWDDTFSVRGTLQQILEELKEEV